MDRRGVEPLTRCLPSIPAHRLTCSPQVRDPRVERGVSCTQGRRIPVFLVPDCGRRPRTTQMWVCGGRPMFHAIRCAVLKIQSRRPRPGSCAWAVGLEPTPSGFGDRRASRCTSPISSLWCNEKPPGPRCGAGGGCQGCLPSPPARFGGPVLIAALGFRRETGFGQRQQGTAHDPRLRVARGLPEASHEGCLSTRWVDALGLRVGPRPVKGNDILPTSVLSTWLAPLKFPRGPRPSWLGSRID